MSLSFPSGGCSLVGEVVFDLEADLFFYSALFYGSVDLFGFKARVDSFNVVALM